MRRADRLLTLPFALLLAHCSDSGGGGAADAGATADGGGACASAPVTELAALPVACSGLAISADALFTLDERGGGETAIGPSRAVVRVPKDGGAAVVFYTPAPPDRLLDLIADASGVFIAEADPAAADELTGRLVRKDIASGAVATVLASGISKVLVELVAVDDAFVYLAQPSRRSGQYGIYRVAKAGGALEAVVEVESGAFRSVQLQGDEFAFAARVNELHRVRKDNGGAPVAAVGTRTCTNGLAATPDAVYCGQPLELEKTGPRFDDPRVLFRVDDVPALDAAGASAPHPRLVTSDAVYVGLNPGAGRRVPLVRVDRVTSTLSTVACALGWVGELVADDQAVYVLQTRDEAFAEKAALLRIPR